MPDPNSRYFYGSSRWGSAVEIPARQAMIVQLVGRDDLQPAIALNSSGFNLARVIGPVVDVEFPPDAMPEIYNALQIERVQRALMAGLTPGS